MEKEEIYTLVRDLGVASIWELDSGKTSDPEVFIEPGIKGEDCFYTMSLHDRQVQSVSGRKPLGAEQNVFGPHDICVFNGKYLIHYTRNYLKCRGYGVFPLNGSIAVKNLLKNFSICHQAFTVRYTALKKLLGIDLVRML